MLKAQDMLCATSQMELMKSLKVPHYALKLSEPICKKKNKMNNLPVAKGKKNRIFVLNCQPPGMMLNPASGPKPK